MDNLAVALAMGVETRLVSRPKRNRRLEEVIATQAKNKQISELSICAAQASIESTNEAQGAELRAAQSANQSNVDIQRSLRNEKIRKIAANRRTIAFLQTEISIFESELAGDGAVPGTELTVI